MFLQKSYIKGDMTMQFDHYRLHHVLRRSGSATIYQAEHIHLNNEVAIKVLNSWLADDANIRKFGAEARLHASLRHPHIIRVLDFGMRGRLPFIVMDYAVGGTLQDHILPGEVLSAHTILPFVLQIANALQYIHDRNLVHRDIKPANILVGERGEMLLSDFGIALAMQPWRQQHVQESIGTAIYAAPEQIDGRPLTASDQYALGVLVYSWLCGHPPFVGSSLQLCQQHLYDEPQPLREQVAIPAEVEGVVLKALAKDPYQRFAHVQDFAQALKEAVLVGMGDVASQHASIAAGRPRETPLLYALAHGENETITG